MENTSSPTIYSIYSITNLLNGKKYVGFTSMTPPEKRMYAHCERRKKSAISHAIQKYSKNAFLFETILQGVDKEYILSMETHFILEYDTICPNGYNLTTGGEGNMPTTSSRRKMSLAKKNKKLPETHRKNIQKNALKGIEHPMYGRIGINNPSYMRKNTEETKRKISNSRKGIIFSDDHKEKLGIKKRGENNPFFGKHFSEDHRKKISESLKLVEFTEDRRRNISNALKKKYETLPGERSSTFLLQFPDGTINRIFGLSYFCKENKINRSSLYKAFAKNKSYKGYKIIKKLEDENV